MPRKAKTDSGIYLRGGTFWGAFQFSGCRYRRSLRTDRRIEARIRFKAWREEVERAGYGEVTSPTYKEAVIRWTREVLPGAVKPAVAKRYLVSIRQITPVLLDLRVNQITRRVVADVVSYRTKRGAGNATIRRDLTALSRLLSACAAWGWIEDNPALYFDRSIIRERRDPIRPPEPASIAKLIAASPPGMAAILTLLHETGMRENEAVTLAGEDIDWERRQINLVRTKTDAPRSIDWKTPAGDATAVLMAAPRAGPLFMPEGKKRPYQNFAANVVRVARNLERRDKTFRRFRVHDLRHGYAIRWLKAGHSIYRLQRQLGHSSVKVTEQYVRYLTNEERERVGVATRGDGEF